jgi:hypothetical protein
LQPFSKRRPLHSHHAIHRSTAITLRQSEEAEIWRTVKVCPNPDAPHDSRSRSKDRFRRAVSASLGRKGKDDRQLRARTDAIDWAERIGHASPARWSRSVSVAAADLMHEIEQQRKNRLAVRTESQIWKDRFDGPSRDADGRNDTLRPELLSASDHHAGHFLALNSTARVVSSQVYQS